MVEEINKLNLYASNRSPVNELLLVPFTQLLLYFIQQMFWHLDIFVFCLEKEAIKSLPGSLTAS